jgi:beta-phosphoglucomutase-like phosphatase (HAD superfamily)
MGKRLADVLASIGTTIGRPLGAEAVEEFQRRTLARLRTHLREVSGVRGYLQSVAHVDCCIASASSPDRLAVCLDVLGLATRFGAHVYSASMVPRGKPHPDLFLLSRRFAHPVGTRRAARRRGCASHRAHV